MAFRISFDGYETGKTLYAYLRKVESGVDVDVWDEAGDAWVSSSIPLASDAERITLTSKAGVETSIYQGATSTDLDSYTGRVKVHIVDVTLNRVIQAWVVETHNGLEVVDDKHEDAASVLQGVESNKAQTIPVLVTKPSNAGPASGTVSSSQIGDAAASPALSNTTNLATYTGSKGVYMVSLTAAETNTTTPQLVRVVTSDGGQGDTVLFFGQRQIEADLADGGRVDQIIDDIKDDTASLRDTQIPAMIITLAALPAATDIADAVWDELSADHIAAGSMGNLVERLDLINPGGNGELTSTRAALLQNLDEAISTRATPAEVLTQADQANRNIGLHLLFETSYNPETPFGVADAFLNELTESDGGVTRFTANALEAGPSGGGGGGASADAVAAAVWNKVQSDHTVAGSFGEIATEIANILTDTNELQTNWASGGSLFTLLDGRATQSSLDGLNNLSTADIDGRLAAIGLDHLVSAPAENSDVVTNSVVGKLASATGVFSTFDPSTDSLQAIRDRGDASWTGSGGGGSAPTVEQIRAEIDANSTQLAAIVADTNELQTDWADGGRLDAILDSRSSHDPAAVRTEIDANSTQLTSILADTNELQTDLTDGGRLDLILDGIKSDTAAILIDSDAIDTTLDTGGVINNLITNITPNPNTLSAETVDGSRTWRALDEKDTAQNIVRMSVSDNATLAMDFSDILNPHTSVASAQGFVRVEGDAGLVVGTAQVSQDHKHIQAKVSGFVAGEKYKIRVSCTTTDNEIISRHGIIKVT